MFYVITFGLLFVIFGFCMLEYLRTGKLTGFLIAGFFIFWFGLAYFVVSKENKKNKPAHYLVIYQTSIGVLNPLTVIGNLHTSGPKFTWEDIENIRTNLVPKLNDHYRDVVILNVIKLDD